MDFSYLVPPGGIWGPWMTLTNSFGVRTYTIEASTLGDSSVFGEVRYGIDGGQQTKQFVTHVQFATGNVIQNIDLRFRSASPLGVALQGTLTS